MCAVAQCHCCHLDDKDFCAALADSRAWCWGASTYSLTDAVELAAHQQIDMVQLAWNIWDQFDVAHHRGSLCNSIGLSGRAC